VDAAEARWNDLVTEMHAVVYEEWALHSVTQGAIDLVPGDPVVHGPWSADECASLLRIWLDLGWLELVADLNPPSDWNLSPANWELRARRDGEFLILQREDARELLGQPERWTVESRDGQVMPALTDDGKRHPFDDWIAQARARLRPPGV
jgi:hypothetical protein